MLLPRYSASVVPLRKWRKIVRDQHREREKVQAITENVATDDAEEIRILSVSSVVKVKQDRDVAPHVRLVYGGVFERLPDRRSLRGFCE
jgi:hypothetical protein